MTVTQAHLASDHQPLGLAAAGCPLRPASPRPRRLAYACISEMKNVARQSLTQQLRDSLAYAQETSRRFDLYIRRDMRITQPLQDAIDEGRIFMRYIP